MNRKEETQETQAKTQTTMAEFKHRLEKRIAYAKEIRELCEANMAVIKERIISNVNHYNGDELIDCLESNLGRYRKELSEKNAKDSEIAMMETIYKSIL